MTARALRRRNVRDKNHRKIGSEDDSSKSTASDQLKALQVRVASLSKGNLKIRGHKDGFVGKATKSKGDALDEEFDQDEDDENGN